MPTESRALTPHDAPRSVTPKPFADPPPHQATRYRLWSEKAVAGTDMWDVEWQPVPPSDQPSIVRRLSRETFQALDAAALLDSCYVFTAEALASLLGESMPPLLP